MPQSVVAQVFSGEWPKLVATLVRDLRDVDAAQDAAQQAFAEAAEKWGPGTTPANPGAWLMTTARRRAIDQIRRDKRFEERREALAENYDVTPTQNQLVDDQLALIFGCCHPALDRPAQVGLTLRTVCGLSTNQIASAFLVSEPTMAKRLVRAKTKIRLAGIPFVAPSTDQLAERLGSVLSVIYLIFTEGHAAADGVALVRGNLCDEARWLAGLVASLLPDEPEASSLAALLCLTDARRPARLDAAGTVVLLDDQDRSLWDQALIAEGAGHLARTATSPTVGPYRVQALIASVHGHAIDASATDWSRIALLYDLLLTIEPTAVVALNRAVALSKANGPSIGLQALDQIEGLESYRYYHSAKGQFSAELGRDADAANHYMRALELTANANERSFLEEKISKLAPQPR